MERGRVRVIGASSGASATWLARLEAAGYAIDREPVTGPDDLKRLARQPPCAVVIDLERAPARGRDIALALRQRVATRRIPIVFVASDRTVFTRLKALPLETMHAGPEDVVTALASALAMPPSGVAPAPSATAGYSGTPLPRKLGVKPGMRVVLVKPPDGFAAVLEPLPPDVVNGSCGALTVSTCNTSSAARIINGSPSAVRKTNLPSSATSEAASMTSRTGVAVRVTANSATERPSPRVDDRGSALPGRIIQPGATAPAAPGGV